ncbi:ABC transporter permease [Nitriliruptoraceae bacterium ZYF776]|nr:ABC transporter permease [Profundirhabdus halotolerans]
MGAPVTETTALPGPRRWVRVGGPRASGRATPRAARSRLRRVATWMIELWPLVVIGVAWELYARTADTLFFPPLSVVLPQFASDWFALDPLQLFLSDYFWTHAGRSLWRITQGLGIAIVVGITLGILLGRSLVLRRMYEPLVRFFLGLPKVVLLPIAIQIFGVAESMNVFLISIGAVWIVLINTFDGITGFDAAWARSAESLRLPRRVFYARVLLPAASPQILTGIRVSLGLGLILMIVSELYATTSGLGYELLYAARTFAYARMWSALLLVALIGVVLNAAFGRFERRLVRWQRRDSLASL